MMEIRELYPMFMVLFMVAVLGGFAAYVLGTFEATTGMTDGAKNVFRNATNAFSGFFSSTFGMILTIAGIVVLIALVIRGITGAAGGRR